MGKGALREGEILVVKKTGGGLSHHQNEDVGSEEKDLAKEELEEHNSDEEQAYSQSSPPGCCFVFQVAHNEANAVNGECNEKKCYNADSRKAAVVRTEGEDESSHQTRTAFDLLFHPLSMQSCHEITGAVLGEHMDELVLREVLLFENVS